MIKLQNKDEQLSCVDARLLYAYLKEKDTDDVIADVTAAVVNPIKEFIVNGENDVEIY